MTFDRVDPVESIHVLVADDNPEILTLMTGLLENRGYVVTGAASGNEAIRKLQEQQTFDLVITDLKMGGADGLDVLHSARDQSPRTKVIIMTGYASLDTAIRAIRGGAYDYITKPFTLDEIEVLLNNVSDHIRMRRTNRLLVAELADAYRRISELEGKGVTVPANPEDAVLVPQDALPPHAGQPGAMMPSGEGIAAYQGAAWTPERAAGRLRAMRDEGALSENEYQRLERLITRIRCVA